MYVNETMAFMILNNQVVLALKWCCSEALINIPYTYDGYTVIQTPWQVQSPWRVVWLLVIGFNPALIGRNLLTHIHHAPRHGRMTGTQVEYTQRFILSLSPLCVWTGRGCNFFIVVRPKHKKTAEWGLFTSCVSSCSSPRDQTFSRFNAPSLLLTCNLSGDSARAYICKLNLSEIRGARQQNRHA